MATAHDAVMTFDCDLDYAIVFFFTVCIPESTALHEAPHAPSTRIYPDRIIGITGIRNMTCGIVQRL